MSRRLLKSHVTAVIFFSAVHGGPITAVCDYWELLPNLKGSYDAISSFHFSLECDKLIVRR